MPDDRRKGGARFARTGATIQSGPLAPAAARAWVTRWLAGLVSEADLDDALLLISELVTNGVRHSGAAAGAPLRISAAVSGDVLRLEVADAGEGGAIARRAPDPGGGGWGLNIVDDLASRWGVEHGEGTQVWCELARQARRESQT